MVLLSVHVEPTNEDVMIVAAEDTDAESVRKEVEKIKKMKVGSVEVIPDGTWPKTAGFGGMKVLDLGPSPRLVARLETTGDDVAKKKIAATKENFAQMDDMWHAQKKELEDVQAERDALQRRCASLQKDLDAANADLQRRKKHKKNNNPRSSSSDNGESSRTGIDDTGGIDDEPTRTSEQPPKGLFDDDDDDDAGKPGLWHQGTDTPPQQVTPPPEIIIKDPATAPRSEEPEPKKPRLLTSSKFEMGELYTVKHVKDALHSPPMLVQQLFHKNEVLYFAAFHLDPSQKDYIDRLDDVPEPLKLKLSPSQSSKRDIFQKAQTTKQAIPVFVRSGDEQIHDDIAFRFTGHRVITSVDTDNVFFAKDIISAPAVSAPAAPVSLAGLL